MDYLDFAIERAARSRDLALAAVIAGDFEGAILAINETWQIVKIARIENSRSRCAGEIGPAIAASNARNTARIASDISRIENSPKLAARAAILGDSSNDQDHNG